MNGIDEVAQSFQEDSPDPDPGGDPGATDAEIDAAIPDEPALEAHETPTMWDHLTRCPSKSVHEADASDWFDPDAGGLDRVALVVEDILGSEGVPNWVHLVVAPIEIALEQQRDEHAPVLEDGDQDEDDEVVPA